jgi:PAS domain S-box-containing protein
VNKGWLDFTDTALHEQLGEAWTGRVHPEDLRRCLDIYEPSLRTRKEFALECRLRRHDDAYRWMICTGVPRFSEDQNFLGYIGSCIDISTRQEAAQEIQRHRMELAHLNRVATMGEFAASIAHELNQPLTAILTNTDAARMILAGDRPALQEIQDILKDIHEDDRRAAEIIRRMRAFLQRHEIVPERIELNSMLEGMIRLVNIEAAARKVAIRFEPAGNPAYVSGDRVHLQQAILNLVLNGFDAMATVPDDKRQLTVRMENESNGMFMITVSDSGTGIPADVSERLFRPFFTTKERGLGMGLSIVRTIVEAHGGRVWAENRGADAGAAFHVVLPALGAPAT